VKQPGVEAEGLIPDAAEAQRRFAAHGLQNAPIDFKLTLPAFMRGKQWRKIFASPTQLLQYLRITFQRIRNKRLTLNYPLVGGYSDLFIVDANSLARFSHYCGVFAATNLFVEIAIPTALVLSCDSIRTEAQTEYPGKALWTQEEMRLLEPYAFDLNRLLHFFPENCLFLHPVKLSRWQFTS
jgi:hypothetical protein